MEILVLMGSVDVVIPNYNYAKWLKHSIRSALTQRGVDVRVLVVDNASSDDSAAIVESMMVGEPRLHLLRHAENMGLLTSLNDGVEWLSADYAVNLSADDQLTPGSLRRGVEVLDANPDVAFAYGPVLVHRDGHRLPRPHGERRRPVVRVWGGEQWLWQAAGSGHVCIRSPEVLARSALVKEVGYSRLLPHSSDMGVCLQLAARGKVAHLRGVQQAIYREHPASLMHSMRDAVITDVSARFDAFELLIKEDADRLQRPTSLLDRARAALATEAVARLRYAYDRGAARPVYAARLLDTAKSIWPPIADSADFRWLTIAPVETPWSAARVARLARRDARAVVRHVRCRQFGQWPTYVAG